MGSEEGMTIEELEELRYNKQGRAQVNRSIGKIREAEEDELMVHKLSILISSKRFPEKRPD